MVKVKIFSSTVKKNNSAESPLEIDINKWLEKNPDIELIDIKFIVGDSPVGRTDNSAYAMIIYKEPTS